MKNLKSFQEFLNESQLNENSLPKDAEKSIKDLAYSMPNHTKSDSDGKFTDEQIKKAIKKYSPVLSQLVRKGMEEEIISKIQEILNESQLNEAIELISMTDAGFSNSKSKTSKKHSDIEDVLTDPDTWTDDLSFKDKLGNVYFIDDLINKSVKIGNKTIMVNETKK